MPQTENILFCSPKTDSCSGFDEDISHFLSSLTINDSICDENLNKFETSFHNLQAEETCTSSSDETCVSSGSSFSDYFPSLDSNEDSLINFRHASTKDFINDEFLSDQNTDFITAKNEDFAKCLSLSEQLEKELSTNGMSVSDLFKSVAQSEYNNLSISSNSNVDHDSSFQELFQNYSLNIIQSDSANSTHKISPKHTPESTNLNHTIALNFTLKQETINQDELDSTVSTDSNRVCPSTLFPDCHSPNTETDRKSPLIDLGKCLKMEDTLIDTFSKNLIEIPVNKIKVSERYSPYCITPGVTSSDVFAPPKRLMLKQSLFAKCLSCRMKVHELALHKVKSIEAQLSEQICKLFVISDQKSKKSELAQCSPMESIHPLENKKSIKAHGLLSFGHFAVEH